MASARAQDCTRLAPFRRLDAATYLVVRAEAGLRGRELGARSSTTTHSARRFAVLKAQDRCAYRDLVVSRARLAVRLRPSRPR